MTKFVTAYITAGSRKEAGKILRILLEKRLAACGNIFPVSSSYRWKGKVEKTKEYTLLAKTQAKHARKIVSAVKSMHSYDVPCVYFLPITEGSRDFLGWIAEETK